MSNLWFLLIATISLVWLIYPTQLAAQLAQVVEPIRKQTNWTPTLGSPSAEIDHAELKKYRAGDAEIFAEYGFSKLRRWYLRNPQKQMVTLDIYEMVDPPAAYGIFTFLRPKNAKPRDGIGNNAFAEDGNLVFQQNRYLVQLQAHAANQDVAKMLAHLAAIIAQELNDRFTLPLVVDKLPRERRLTGSEKFTMGRVAFNQLLPLKQPDAFGMETGAEAAMASYVSGREAASMFVILYPTQQLAKKFLEAGYAEYSKTYPQRAVYYKRDGPMVALILDSNSPELATSLLDQVSYVSSVSWDPKVQPPSIAEVMLRIFMFCGIMLGITLAAGLVFGVIRIIVKRFFPGKIFDRAKTMEVIRLNLGTKK